MNPTVSICIPTYNGEKYVAECLQSVAAQTYSDFETLVVDDCSSDKTLEIAGEFASRDSRIRIVRNDHNLGLVGNWNRCASRASGEWIKYVFQDDLLYPTCLERMITKARPDRPIRFCHRDILAENDESFAQLQSLTEIPAIHDIFAGVPYVESHELASAAVARIGVNFLGEPTSAILHRSVFDRFGPFNTDFVQICDLEYWLRVGVNCGIEVIPMVLAIFRVHASSTSSTNHQTRMYGKEFLDPLMLRYEMAYNPHYAPLRRVAAELGLTRRLVRDLDALAFHARQFAETYDADESAVHGSLVAEWDALTDSHPRLVRTLGYRAMRAHQLADRHLLWRLRKRGTRPAD